MVVADPVDEDPGVGLRWPLRPPLPGRVTCVRRNKTKARNHLVTRTQTADPAQTEIIARWDAASAPIGNRVVGSITADLTRSENRTPRAPWRT